MVRRARTEEGVILNQDAWYEIETLLNLGKSFLYCKTDKEAILTDFSTASTRVADLELKISLNQVNVATINVVNAKKPEMKHSARYVKILSNSANNSSVGCKVRM